MSAIRLVCPLVHFYKRQGGGVGSRGHVISFAQDVSGFAEEILNLPRAPNELPIIILESKDCKKTRKFKANSHKILAALEWLKKNNEDYANVNISQEKIDLYRLRDGQFLDGLKTIDCVDDGNSKDSRSSSENQLLSKPIKEPKEFSSSSDSGREDEPTKPIGNRL